MKNKILNATGLMIFALGGSASADVIYSNFLNTTIATTYTGTDVNVGDGSLNLFFGGAGVANDSEFQPFRIASGGLGTMKSFVFGDTIDSGAGTLATGSGGSVDHLGTEFTGGTEAYLGFQLDAANFGWMRGTFTYATSGALIKDWAYDNSGTAIKAGLIQTNVTGAGLTTTTLDVGSSDSFALGSALTNGVAGGYTNSVLKLGDGTVTLKGTNTYSGTTEISAGTLALGTIGSIANTSSIKVASGATFDVSAVTGGWSLGASQRLGGSGDVTGNATISGIHNAGDAATNNGVGSQDFSADLTYDDGSMFEWDIKTSVDGTGTAGTDFDSVSATGSITVGTTSTVFKVILGDDVWTDMQDTGNVFWNTPFGTQTWSMAAIFGQSFATGAFQSVDTNHDVSAYGTFSISSSQLTWTAIPEPSTALGGLLLTAGLLRRRRHANA